MKKFRDDAVASRDIVRRVMNYALNLSRRIFDLQARTDKTELEISSICKSLDWDFHKIVDLRDKTGYQMRLVYQILELQTTEIAELRAEIGKLNAKDRTTEAADPVWFPPAEWQSGCAPRSKEQKSETTYSTLA